MKISKYLGKRCWLMLFAITFGFSSLSISYANFDFQGDEGANSLTGRGERDDDRGDYGRHKGNKHHGHHYNDRDDCDFDDGDDLGACSDRKLSKGHITLCKESNCPEIGIVEVCKKSKHLDKFLAKGYFLENVYVEDNDGDGTYLENSEVISCKPPGNNFIVKQDAEVDCDDTNPEIAQGVTYYQDSDGDGAGNPNESLIACGLAPDGYVTNDYDCDDTTANSAPYATVINNIVTAETNNGTLSFEYGWARDTFGWSDVPKLDDVINNAITYEGLPVLGFDGTNFFGCNPLVGDHTGKTVVFVRGVCPFTTKAINAQNAGAQAIVLINNVPGGGVFEAFAGISGITIPYVIISYEDGQTLFPNFDGTLNPDITDFTIGTPVTVCPSICGNSYIEAGEACDDGNLVSGDGCNSDCTIIDNCPCFTTANQVVEIFNDVDDNRFLYCNLNAPFGTSGGTRIGTTISDGSLLGSFNQVYTLVDKGIDGYGECSTRINGVINPIPFSGSGENTNEVISGYCHALIAEAASIVCESVCGNGVVEGREQCDDGNDVNDDACTNYCYSTLPPTAACTNDSNEPNEWIDSATPITPGIYNNLQLCNIAENIPDFDYYAIELNQGDQLIVSIFFENNNPYGNLELDLLDINGARINDSFNTTRTFESMVHSVTYTGTHFIRIYPWDVFASTNAGENSYDMEIFLSSPAP